MSRVTEIVVPPAQRSGSVRAVKSLIEWIFRGIVIPRVAVYLLTCRIAGRRAAFVASSEAVARGAGFWGRFYRQAFYRMTLAHCGPDVHFGWLSTIASPQCRIGREVYIGKRCSIGTAKIEDGVMLADGCQILSGRRQHEYAGDGEEHREQPQTFEMVSIGRGAWIGAGAIVMADVGEGAVVTQPVAARHVVAGVPAKTVRVLDS